MSDRHLYKAKRTDNGEWVEGYYMPRPNFPKGGIHYIVSVGDTRWHEVDPFTLCQCIWHKDKNGKLIWENDICIIHNSSIDEEDGYFLVKWDDDSARFILCGEGLIVDFDNFWSSDLEIIGNAIDNPSLLEGGTE
ncbi:MAG: hypothetical protein J6C19_05785 [Lachnospiraceae bacterium]|nr:hypothetical protein [Lachnospiraceae bacterium]